MENFDLLKTQLKKCKHILNKGYTSTRESGIPWLNNFCAEFLHFTNGIHKFIVNETNKNSDQNENDHIDTIYLCLTQIVTCIKHMECTLKAEDIGGMAISSSRQHFLDRIHWCLERLYTSIKNLRKMKTQQNTIKLNESTFVDLMDLVFNHLAPYSSYKDDNNDRITNIAEENAEAMFGSKEIRSTVDSILSQTLAFANVALKEDKKALSALCQKVLRECMAFQDECKITENTTQSLNRKLKAISLETALYQLEDFINEALLRLVYVSFLDYQTLSIDKLRTIIRTCGDNDDSSLDELIADFDVNIDRTTQIGIFAIAFAPNSKIQTVIRSCLASLESLDSYIIPSIQTNSTDMYSEILEQHFNEEITTFKKAIQEIIDGHAFTTCYYEMLTKCINQSNKNINIKNLQEIIEMGEFLYEHFQLPVNMKAINEKNRKELYEKFALMLKECQAILKCANQVEPERILKRLKILRSILCKFIDSLQECSPMTDQVDEIKNLSKAFLLSDELSESHKMFESIGISPSIKSILYDTEKNSMLRRAASDSLKGNYSKLPLTAIQDKNDDIKIKPSCLASSNANIRASVRRRQSLRTAMFKRQKSNETEKIYTIYRNQSSNLQITEILDQLTELSANFSSQNINDQNADLNTSVLII